MESMRQRAAQGLKAGDRFTIVRSFTPDEITAFAALSKDYNPVHFDKGYTDLKGMRAPIAHGLLTASLITQIGGQIGWLAATMTFRFRRPVYASDVLTCNWVILDIDDKLRARADVQVVNGDGHVVLEAETTGIVPGAPERQRLAEMLAEGDPSNALSEAEKSGQPA